LAFILAKDKARLECTANLMKRKGTSVERV
jgi:hypothetical protein